METVEAVVIGAGVIGLAVARELAQRGQAPLVLEQGQSWGQGISARNSEVIHAGLYYPPGSLKARHCVEGRQRLLDFCQRRNVPHQLCGKWVVAVDESQRGELAALQGRGEANGVAGLRLLERGEWPAELAVLRGVAALDSPATGIINAHAYMLALLGEAEDAGATLVSRARFSRAEACAEGFRLWLDEDGEAQLLTRRLVNAAGLDAVAVAGRIAADRRCALPKAHCAKGSYFSLSGRSPFTRLIYPLPEPGGLGVHLTLDLAGAARFGPDVEWCPAPDYAVDPARLPDFAAAIRRYWPGLEASRLQAAYAGVRPKISGPGEPAADFLLLGPGQHGVAGLVDLLGIESPGLTASLSLAAAAADALLS